MMTQEQIQSFNENGYLLASNIYSEDEMDKMEEAYESVSWSTVFLLASLIPLGFAVETSGTAKWIAEQTLLVVGDMPIWVIQASVAILATFFTLVMSNVGATVLLVPLAVNIAIGAGANPAIFALTVAVATRFLSSRNWKLRRR